MKGEVGGVVLVGGREVVIVVLLGGIEVGGVVLVGGREVILVGWT